MPCTLVARLFLRPDDRFGIWIGGDLLPEFFVRKRIELLDAQYRDVLNRPLGAFGDEIVVDLARAKNQSLHFLGVELFRLPDHHFKFAVG